MLVKNGIEESFAKKKKVLEGSYEIEKNRVYSLRPSGGHPPSHSPTERAHSLY